MNIKYCPRCETNKPHSDFYRAKARSDGLHWMCKPCNYIYQSKWAHKKNPYTAANKARQRRYNEKKKAADPVAYVTNHRKHFLKTKYGLSVEEYLWMLERQNGKCAICKVHHDEIKFRLAIDHCHKTGKLRGLLCRKCNSGIALLGEREDNFLGAIAYLKNHAELDPS